MSLTPGTRIGPYEITGVLGTGGMGEVYRARDAKLNRDVALKILPESFAADAERVARFRREAQVLASLNHPHIAAIYGFEDSGTTHALVLELVEGPTLADRIAQGPLPLDEALHIAKQIAEALEAAHEQGIIHRDLKPANIKVRDDGTVKVLDFGLAKAYEPASALHLSLSNSPTITSPAMLTGVGMILGTAAYMAPEQAKGRPADKRCDVWAFGCVLFEMLTGKRAFEGDDVSDTLAAVLRAEPDWRVLETRVDPALARVISRCLAKDRSTRLRDIGDVRLELQDAAAAPAPAPSAALRDRPGTGVWRAIAIVAVAFLIGAAAEVVVLRQASRPDDPPAKFTITLPDVSFGGLGAQVAVSPDGRQIAFVAITGSSPKPRIFVRPLDQDGIQPIRGTDGVEGSPFWSPDSRELAFVAGNKLKRVAVANGGLQIICDTSSDFGMGTWNAAGDIVFATSATEGLRRVPAAGGKPVTIVAPDGEQRETRLAYPEFIGDGSRFVFTSVRSASGTALRIGSLDGKTITTLSEDAGHAMFVPPDHLTFWRSGALFVQQFDVAAGKLRGNPRLVADDVMNGGFSRGDIRAVYSVSRGSVLAYQPGSSSTLQSQLTWIDRSGRELGAVGTAGGHSTLQLSPDETMAAVGRASADGGGTSIWVVDLRRNIETRLTFGTERDSNPAWSPDAKRIAFNSTRNGRKNVYDMSSSGGGETTLLEESKSTGPISVSDRSKDGRFLIFNLDLTRDLWALPLQGADRKPIQVVHPVLGRSDQPNFSPDGRFIAYNGEESGRAEVYVVPFPPTGEKWQVSSNGGVQPRWRGDGRELVYLAPEGTMMAADVTYQRRFETAAPHPLFKTSISPLFQTEQFAMTRDGQRFLIMKPVAPSGPGPSLMVVLNWLALARR